MFRPEKPEIHLLTREQALALLDAAHGDKFEALYVVAIHCGLREGELLGLKWADVDLESGMLQVRRTLSETRTGHIFENPKNGKGRSVKLSRKATEALRAHRARQNEERLRAGSLWQDNDLVFPTTMGTTMSGTNLLGRHFKPLLNRAELPAIRLHDLRHTCATILLVAGKHPKIRPGASRAREHLHNPRHLQPRDRGDGRRAGRRDGRGVMRRGYCCPTAAIED